MYLAKASRGAGKGALWGRMLQYKSNEYIMGAGTVEADQADHWIQDMGLVFGQTYTIYDVRAIDGHKLIKLRNPPGDHDEWHGDWGDASPKWKDLDASPTGPEVAKAVDFSPGDDGTFFMAWDDFKKHFNQVLPLAVARLSKPRRSGRSRTTLRGRSLSRSL